MNDKSVGKELIFNKLARKNMKDFDLNEFKNTHPSLFKTIIDSMEEYHLKRSKNNQRPKISQWL